MKKSKKDEQSLRQYISEKKGVFGVYLILRLFVVATLVLQIFEGDYESTAICLLTLALFVMPSVVERRLRIDLPDALEIVILLFIFAAEILGEIKEFYVLVPHWDTVLHTINGFLFAAIGFCMVNVLNNNKNIAMHLSPFYVAVAAFCFSMTIGVLWEFFEWAMDSWFHMDMQKDAVIGTINSVTLHPEGKNQVIHLENIKDTILMYGDGTQQALGLGGYLDIGLLDTMKDMFVNLIGAVVFSVIGYFYIKTKGKGKVARLFIPTLKEDKNEDEH